MMGLLLNTEGTVDYASSKGKAKQSEENSISDEIWGSYTLTMKQYIFSGKRVAQKRNYVEINIRFEELMDRHFNQEVTTVHFGDAASSSRLIRLIHVE